MRKVHRVAIASAATAGFIASYMGPAHAAGETYQRVTMLSPVAPDDLSASALCSPGKTKYTRTTSCRVLKGYDILLDSKKGVKWGAWFTFTQTVNLDKRKLYFTEHDTFQTTHVVGFYPGGFVAKLKATSCGAGCSASNHVPAFVSSRAPHKKKVTGTISYRTAIASGRKREASIRYSLYEGSPKAAHYTFHYYGTKFRCDNMIKGYSPGCVFPAAIPTMYSMQKLPKIAKNIRQIQARGNGHYGRPGSGHPLHRLANRTKQNDNRRKVCARKVVGPPPKAGVSCDEYPFASTREGGKALSSSNRGTAWVPVSEQGSQRGLITAFYNGERVLDGEAFWVAV